MPSQNHEVRGFRWFTAVIRNQAFNARRRYLRYRRREIAMLNSPSEDGHEPIDSIPCLWAGKDFEKSELWTSIKEVLSNREFRIIYNVFAHGNTEYEIASQLGLSQQHVNRIKNNALRRLRKELVE